jgi:DsbC/DsbD-like thiol-disulfide interchange protein
MIRVALLLGMTLCASPVLAAATAWQEVASGASLRLISADTLDNGAAVAGVELQLPAGSNTYWRIPGDSGIPTLIDLSASTGVTAPEIVWPYPRVENAGGYRDFVYRGTIVVPIRFKAGEGAVLDVSLTLGVCSDICIPARAHLSMPLSFAKPDAAQSIRLTQALSDAPIAWDKPGEPVGDVHAIRDGSGLVIANPSPSIDPLSLIADAGDPAQLFGTPQKSPDGAVWTLQLLGGGNIGALVGQQLRLTYMTDTGPYSSTREISPATP